MYFYEMCGGLNIIDSHHLMGNGAVRRCGFVMRVYGIVKRKCVTVGVGFEVSYVQDTTQCLSQTPVACKM